MHRELRGTGQKSLEKPDIESLNPAGDGVRVQAGLVNFADTGLELAQGRSVQIPGLHVADHRAADHAAGLDTLDVDPLAVMNHVAGHLTVRSETHIVQKQGLVVSVLGTQGGKRARHRPHVDQRQRFHYVEPADETLHDQRSFRGLGRNAGRGIVAAQSPRGLILGGSGRQPAPDETPLGAVSLEGRDQQFTLNAPIHAHANRGRGVGQLGKFPEQVAQFTTIFSRLHAAVHEGDHGVEALERVRKRTVMKNMSDGEA